MEHIMSKIGIFKEQLFATIYSPKLKIKDNGRGTKTWGKHGNGKPKTCESFEFI